MWVFSLLRLLCCPSPLPATSSSHLGEFQHDLAFHPRRLAPAVFAAVLAPRCGPPAPALPNDASTCRRSLAASLSRLAQQAQVQVLFDESLLRPARSGAERQLRGARGAGAVAGRFRAGAGGGGRRLRGAPAPGRRLQRQRTATGRADHRRQRSRSGRQQRRPFDPDPAGYRTPAGGQHPQPAADPARSDHGRLAQAGRTDHQHLGPG